MPATDSRRRIDYLPIGALTPALRNPKKHDNDALTASIAEFGYVEPVLLDERTGRLVAGHGRVANLAAMESTGRPVPDGVNVDESGRWLIPVARGWSSRDDAEADAYLVASNRLVEKGGWDNTELAYSLADIRAAGGRALSDLTGFRNDEVTAILDNAGVTDPLASIEPLDDDLDPAPDGDPDDKYRQRFGLIIPCAHHDEAQRITALLTDQGYQAKVIVV